MEKLYFVRFFKLLISHETNLSILYKSFHSVSWDWIQLPFSFPKADRHGKIVQLDLFGVACHRYRRETPDVDAIILPAWDSNWGILGFIWSK